MQQTTPIKLARVARWPLLAGRVGRTVRPSPEVVAVVAGVLVWELIGRVVAFVFLPPFTVVLSAWWELFQTGRLTGSLVVSLLALGIGFGLAALLGITLGALMARYRKVEYLLDFYVNVMLSSPTLAYVPILFVFFGISDVTRVAVVFLYSFFVIVVNTFTGIRQADSNLIEMGRSFGASERQLFWRVMIPNALPMMMAGLRLGVGRAVKGMINGELLIALVGLGAQLRLYGGSFDSPKVLAILLTVIIVALIATAIVQGVDRRLTRWAD
jgi:ABC-type nitrate/sulfonate/bicarbonate transport system permease component